MYSSGQAERRAGVIPDTFWKMELMETTRKRRSLALKFLLPFIILIPLLIPAIPLPVRTAGFTLALVFIGVFGAAVGLIRIREDRLAERLALLPVPPWRLVGGYLGANAFVDGLQFLLPLIIFVVPAWSDPVAFSWIGLCFLSVIAAANAIGVFIAIATRSSGEGHLVAILVVLGIIGISGLFMPVSQEVLFVPGMLLPFRNLSDALLIGMGGATSDPWLFLAPVSAAILVLIAVLLAPRFFRRIPGRH
jgi:ABC-type multidrug transport system permease subunit